jgi:tetratricopeptide (TPR) repeat protein
MPAATAKSVIFISYSHKDEPEHPRDGEVQWLSFVRTYLQPAAKEGIFTLWEDQHLKGGDDWDPEIEAKLHACDIFILLVSANSMASDYIVDKEIAIIRERQAKEDKVHFYPLLLMPTPKAGLDKVRDKNLRPRDAKAFSGYSPHDRAQHMTDAADEIAALAAEIAKRKSAAAAVTSRGTRLDVTAGLAVRAKAWNPDFDISHLPETAYERLVGRGDQLKVLDEAWADRKTDIVSLIAEGGAGKSALVNEWLKQLQADNYRGAEAVLGWSFYSQGTKERATSAEEFLNWALHKLGIKLETTSATAKGEAIAEGLMRRRVLLVLDGVEPLQHGPDAQLGQLKDLGVRALLRRFAATPAVDAHGLIVLTSRLAVEDIKRWRDGSAPVIDVDRLSDEAGAALLRDNGVWGTDKELKAATHDFDGHPLALGLLATFLKETQTGDVRRRDHIRVYLADPDNPRHDHARRVMESYEREWLAEQPVLIAIMQIVGLFDRPASVDCLKALRQQPVIKRLTDQIVKLDEEGWQRAIARLREIRLLAPADLTAPGALDAHPLIREWFGERLRQRNEAVWKAAHGRLYEHLRDTTREGESPRLEDLAPLYQAIAHGCRAGRHEEALDQIYVRRVSRRQIDGRLEFYSIRKLGAASTDLATISWFFSKPYEVAASSLRTQDRSWVLSTAAFLLRAQGRFVEALSAIRAALQMHEVATQWSYAAVCASILSELELFLGQVANAVAIAKASVDFADRGGDKFESSVRRTTLGDALHAAGQLREAESFFIDAERRQRESSPNTPSLDSLQGYEYCDLLLTMGNWESARKRAGQTLEKNKDTYSLLDRALDNLTLGRATLCGSLESHTTSRSPTEGRDMARNARSRLDEAVDSLRASGNNDDVPRGLLARTTYYRSIGDWDGAARDLDEVEEIAEPGPMRLHLCDMAFQRARLAFAQIQAFAPLNGMMDKDNPPKPTVPSADEIAQLKAEAEKQLDIAADYVDKCGYHRRDEELAELQAVLRGEKKFAELPPRV